MIIPTSHNITMVINRQNKGSVIALNISCSPAVTQLINCLIVLLIKKLIFRADRIIFKLIDLYNRWSKTKTH